MRNRSKWLQTFSPIANQIIMYTNIGKKTNLNVAECNKLHSFLSHLIFCKESFCTNANTCLNIC